MAANGEEAAAPVPLLRFESLCGALRTGLTEAITLKTESDKGAAAFLALQSSAMGLLELKEVRVPRAPCAPHMDPHHESIVASSLLSFPSSARRVAACRLPPTPLPAARPGEPLDLGEGGGGQGLVQGGVPRHGRR